MQGDVSIRRGPSIRAGHRRSQPEAVLVLRRHHQLCRPEKRRETAATDQDWSQDFGYHRPRWGHLLGRSWRRRRQRRWACLEGGRRQWAWQDPRLVISLLLWRKPRSGHHRLAGVWRQIQPGKLNVQLIEKRSSSKRNDCARNVVGHFTHTANFWT